MTSTLLFWVELIKKALPVQARGRYGTADLRAVACLKKWAYLSLILLAAVATAQAATITVDADCSLANAIRSANGDDQESPLDNCEAGDSGGDTIHLSANITVTSRQPAIESEIVIQGGGRSISGGSTAGILGVDDGAVLTISRLTLTDARTTAFGAAIVQAGGQVTINSSVIRDNRSGGGAVGFIDGTLTIRNSSIFGNHSSGHGGGIYVHDADSSASVTVLNTTIFDNSAQRNGGGLYLGAGAAVTLTNVTVYRNEGQGGLYNLSQLTMRNTIIAGNTNPGNDPQDCLGSGGAISPSSNNNNLIRDGGINCSPDYSGSPGLSGNATGSPPYFALQPGSRAIDKGDCAALPAGDRRDQRGTSRPQGSACDIGAYEFIPSASGTRSLTRARPVASKAPVYTGETLNRETDLVLSVAYGMRSGIQFQRVDASGVGIQSVLDLGFLDAVDVWGYVAAGVEVCFPKVGVIVFLDAKTSPRTVTTVTQYTRPGLTCAALDRAGTVVLVAGLVPPDSTTAGAAATPLSGCMVTTTHLLNLRQTPGGAVIGFVPQGARLTALARTPGWFQVDNNGVIGWISADYVTNLGACG